jgi:deazaflavin-dependent oxidoreductase (nitroreductase family)
MPKWVRVMFKILNKYFMVPMYRLGLGPILGNPLSGYIMVLKVIGRKSGKTRFAPVNYAIHKGFVYCISGGRDSSDWYKNLLAHPDIELILPGGAIFGKAEVITDDADRLTIIRQILKNAGFAGFFEGYNPRSISDEALMSKSADLPLIRITPIGIGNGASDQGGWLWLLGLAITVVVILAIILIS